MDVSFQERILRGYWSFYIRSLCAREARRRVCRSRFVGRHVRDSQSRTRRYDTMGDVYSCLIHQLLYTHIVRSVYTVLFPRGEAGCPAHPTPFQGISTSPYTGKPNYIHGRIL